MGATEVLATAIIIFFYFCFEYLLHVRHTAKIMRGMNSFHFQSYSMSYTIISSHFTDDKIEP